MPDSSPPPAGRWPEPPSGVAAAPSLLKTPRPATPELLRKELDSKPLLWVGAGTSVAAGFPTTEAILQALAERADEPLDLTAPFPRVVDAFVASRGRGELGDILQRLFQPRSPSDKQPTPVHRALARLAGAGVFHAIATTNYDDLLERALGDEGVPCVLQTLEGNAEIAGDGQVRLLKLHGSYTEWRDVVLSGHSYAAFGRSYPFLSAQLDVLLRQRPVLFVGCSLQDPRLLDWLAAQTPEAAEHLKSWRALMTKEAWTAATAATWEGGYASGALSRGNLKALLLHDHNQLGLLWSAVAAAVAPPLRELVLTLTVGAEGEPWRAELPGVPGWQPADPLVEEDLLEALDLLRARDHKALLTTEKGELLPAAASAAAALLSLATQIGERLTAALLSPGAREALAAAVRAGFGGEPPLLHLEVRAAGTGETLARRADRALALPWELLRLEERFPVEEGTLDLLREAWVPGVRKLEPPTQPLSVVATFAAPVDAAPLDVEDEMYRLWLALGREAEENRLRVTDLGTLDELAREVERVHPPVFHFSGHGKPGALYFEDEAALAEEVEVDELVRRLREAGPLPRLVYLSACHGATAGGAAAGRPGERASAGPAERMVDLAISPKETRPSTAASLHRAGFPQVVAYFGPVGDQQATRAAATFYAALATGQTARKALRKARRLSTEPHEENGRATHVYPLGWAQLALYHRGGDLATALPTTAGEAALDLEKQQVPAPLTTTGRDETTEAGLRGVQRLRYGFIGRRRERAEAVRRWRKGERRLIVLGLGGLGKTALCAELAPILARGLAGGVQPAPILALSGRDAAAQPNPLAALWGEVQAARSDDDWSTTLAGLQKDGLTGAALAGAIRALAQDHGLLVYLDDAESLQEPVGEGEIGRFRDPEVRHFWELLLAATPTTAQPGSLGLLASSRYLPEGTPQASALPLPPLHPYEIVRLLGWMPTLHRSPAEDRAWLAQQIDGHPRTVEYLEGLARVQEESLAAPGGHYSGSNWRKDILEPALPKTQAQVTADLLLERLWSTLPPEAQEHLGRTTVLTAPAPWPAILSLEPQKGTAQHLVKTGLLSPFQPPSGEDNWWAPHRLVAEEVRRHWKGDPQAANRRIGEWYKAQLQEESLRVWAERAVQHLAEAGAGDEAWPAACRLAIHLRDAGRIREALAWVQRALAAGPSGSSLASAMTFEVQLGRLASAVPNQAEERLLQALDLVEPGDKSFVLNELGKLAQRNGDLSRAAEYLTRSLSVTIEHNGDFHPFVATALHALAGVRLEQGDFGGAKRNLERALEIQAEVFGAEMGLGVAASLHELARALQGLGNLLGAKRHFERSLEISAQVFGTEIHPGVAATLHELASVLQMLGDLEGARRNLERALEIKARVFRTELHPDVAASHHDLGIVLQAQGDLISARENIQRSLLIQQEVFGTEVHPGVARSLQALAGILRAQGDYEGARRHVERALEVQVEVFHGEVHPDIAGSLHELALVRQAMGDLEGARRHFTRSLQIQTQVFGTREHFVSAISERNLGHLLLQMGDFEAGEELLVHAHSVFLKQLGANHPYTRQLADFLKKDPKP